VRPRSLGAIALAATLVLALAGCGGVARVAYNNGDVALRFVADDYFDLHGEQREVLKTQLVRFHAWHRREELPRYATLFGGASERIEKGLTREDVTWAIASVRARYRATVEQVADEAPPLVATFGPENFSALEKKLVTNNEKFAKEFLAGDARKQAKARAKRLAELFEDWLGDLTHEQEAVIERFVQAQPDMNRIRLEDRRRRQAQFVALLRDYQKSPELAARLREYFVHWERDRGAEHRRQALEWEARLATLVLDIDQSLSPRQRRNAVQKFAAYAEDARVLAREGRPTGPSAGVGAAIAAQ
jgi:hypothetical protein